MTTLIKCPKCNDNLVNTFFNSGDLLKSCSNRYGHNIYISYNKDDNIMYYDFLINIKSLTRAIIFFRVKNIFIYHQLKGLTDPCRKEIPWFDIDILKYDEVIKKIKRYSVII